MNFFHHVLIHDNRQKTQQADKRDKSLKTWQQELVQGYVPGRMVLAISSNETKLEGALAKYVVKGGQTLAYICRAGSCERPVTDLTQFRQVLL